MKNLSAIIFLPLLLLFSFASVAQDFGQVRGTIYDEETGEPGMLCNVVLMVGEEMVQGQVSDFDGNFNFTAVPPGEYDIKVIYLGYEPIIKRGIVVKPGALVTEKLYLKQAALTLDEVEIVGMPRRESMSVASVEMSVSGRRGRTSKRGSAGADYKPAANGGLLTAGEVNDFAKWKLWLGYADDERERMQQHWNFHPVNRYQIQLTNDDGWPVVDQLVELVDPAGTSVWKAKTDQSGRAELWAGMFGDDVASGKYMVKTKVGGKTYEKKARPFSKGITAMELPVNCGASKDVDIMFVVDATGSMGDEIYYLKAELDDIITKAKRRHKSLNLNLGSVFYRDKGDAYVTKASDLSSNVKKAISFIGKQSAAGGGDGPEAVETALEEAINKQPWRKEARARLLFLVLDAPPHHTPEIMKQLHDLSRQAAEKGIRIIPLSGSGIDKETEYLMRFFALSTNGTYTFLTDDSGIGGEHLEPTTDSYDVELMNDLVLRLIDQYTEVPECGSNDITELSDKLVDGLQQAVERNVVNQADSTTATPMELEIKVLPNPTAGEFQVSFEGQPNELYITDLSGKLLMRRIGMSEGVNESFDLTDYANGMYIVVAVYDEGAASDRIVVQH